MFAAREEIFECLMPWASRPAPGEAESANELLDAFAAEVRRLALREARDAIRADLNALPEAEPFSYGHAYAQGMDWAARVVDGLTEEK